MFKSANLLFAVETPNCLVIFSDFQVGWCRYFLEHCTVEQKLPFSYEESVLGALTFQKRNLSKLLVLIYDQYMNIMIH